MFRTSTGRSLDLGLVILRAAIGAIFVAHGAQKLFEFGIAGLTDGFESMGVPMAGVVAPAVALTEFLGGFALIAGLLTRVTGAGLAVIMLGALLIAHLPAGFFLPNGYEFVLALGAGSAALALTGAGAFSVDALIARRSANEDVVAGSTRRAA